MMLILYGKEEKEFKSFGLGVLKEVRNDEVREALNSQFELTLQYPVTGRLFGQLDLDCWIKARPNPLQEPQPFRIYRITKAMNGWVTLYARHLCYQLKRYVRGAGILYPSPLSEEVEKIGEGLLPACPFKFWSDFDKSVRLELAEAINGWDLLGGQKGLLSARDSLEYSFDCYQVNIHTRRGKDRGVSILYGKNLRDVTVERRRDEEYGNVLYPYWTGRDGEIHALPEGIVEDPYLEEGEEVVVRPADCSSFDWEYLFNEVGVESEEQAVRDIALLGYWLRAYLGTRTSETEPTLDVDFVQLSKTEEYRERALPDSIDLGDTVRVEYPDIGISYTARVNEIRFQPSTGLYKKITLGSPKATLIRSLKGRINEKKGVTLDSSSYNSEAAAAMTLR